MSDTQSSSHSVDDHEKELRQRQQSEYFLQTHGGRSLQVSIGVLLCLSKIIEVDGVNQPISVNGINQAAPDYDRMRRIQDGFTANRSGESPLTFNTDGVTVFMCDVQSLGDASGEECVSSISGGINLTSCQISQDHTPWQMVRLRKI